MLNSVLQNSSRPLVVKRNFKTRNMAQEQRVLIGRMPLVHQPLLGLRFLLPTGLPSWQRDWTGPIMLIVLFLVSHFNFLIVPCGGLSWLPVSFLRHVKYTLSYRIVTSAMDDIPWPCYFITFTRWRYRAAATWRIPQRFTIFRERSVVRCARYWDHFSVCMSVGDARELRI